MISPQRKRQLAFAVAGYQVLDTIGNAIPRQFVKRHLDHLGVPEYLRPLLPIIKLSGSAGLVIGLKVPRLGALTAGCLVAYYAAAAQFHVASGDHPIMAVPAAELGAAAAFLLFNLYLPTLESDSPIGV